MYILHLSTKFSRLPLATLWVEAHSRRGFQGLSLDCSCSSVASTWESFYIRGDVFSWSGLLLKCTECPGREQRKWLRWKSSGAGSGSSRSFWPHGSAFLPSVKTLERSSWCAQEFVSVPDSFLYHTCTKRQWWSGNQGKRQDKKIQCGRIDILSTLTRDA